jgi:hypothetical protein
MMPIAADPVIEALRILTAARAARVPLRAMGGVGIALVSPTIRRLTPPRVYHDIDLVAPGGAPAVTDLLIELGYEPARRFNALNGAERLLFHDAHGRRIDVFIGTLRMCHRLSLRDSFATPSWSLPLADLVLSKLQIVELTERDAQDLLALFVDFQLTGSDPTGIAIDRITGVCGGDWGWWRTVDDNLRRLTERWHQQRGSTDPDASWLLGVGTVRAGELREAMASSPRSVGWRLRAMVGPRRRWYDLPEEVRAPSSG